MNFEDMKSEISPLDNVVDAGLVSNEESEKFISGGMQVTDTNCSIAITAVAIICQKGGTSKRAQGTRL